MKPTPNPTMNLLVSDTAQGSPFFLKTLDELVEAINQSDCDIRTSRRVVEKWIEAGAPGKTDRGYDLLAIFEWKTTQGISITKAQIQTEYLKKCKLLNDELEKKSISRRFVEDKAFELGAALRSLIMPMKVKITSLIKGGCC